MTLCLAYSLVCHRNEVGNTLRSPGFFELRSISFLQLLSALDMQDFSRPLLRSSAISHIMVGANPSRSESHNQLIIFFEERLVAPLCIQTMQSAPLQHECSTGAFHLLLTVETRGYLFTERQCREGRRRAPNTLPSWSGSSNSRLVYRASTGRKIVTKKMNRG